VQNDPTEITKSSVARRARVWKVITNRVRSRDQVIERWNPSTHYCAGGRRWIDAAATERQPGLQDRRLTRLAQRHVEREPVARQLAVLCGVPVEQRRRRLPLPPLLGVGHHAVPDDRRAAVQVRRRVVEQPRHAVVVLVVAEELELVQRPRRGGGDATAHDDGRRLLLGVLLIPHPGEAAVEVRDPAPRAADDCYAVPMVAGALPQSPAAAHAARGARRRRHPTYARRRLTGSLSLIDPSSALLLPPPPFPCVARVLALLTSTRSPCCCLPAWLMRCEGEQVM
jgi:hypothetical protein